jgi:hypothetical protein
MKLMNLENLMAKIRLVDRLTFDTGYYYGKVLVHIF